MNFPAKIVYSEAPSEMEKIYETRTTQVARHFIV